MAAKAKPLTKAQLVSALFQRIWISPKKMLTISLIL